jgi:hypothetical protein
LTLHAGERADELGFTVEEVARCVRQPEQSYTCHGRYGQGRRTYQRDEMAVVLDERRRLVVTVLLRRQDEWVHGTDTRARC